MLRNWEKLPDFMRTEAVRPYYDSLQKKRSSLIIKRIFDFLAALLMLLILLPILLVLSVMIVKDSKGGVFYCQERVTQYGRRFKIYKFRTMVANADKIGSQVTVENDIRVTKVGKILRDYRLDELPQLVNILLGDMSFVGTRPESLYYVKNYTPVMFATLLLPAGVTSEASIRYKDEAKLLNKVEDADDIYINQVLPEKMKYNLESLRNFSLMRDIRTILATVIAVITK